MWNERGNRSLRTMLGLKISKGFRLRNVYWRQDKGFGKIARRPSFVDESTAPPSALDGTKEAGLSYHTAITFYQTFSDIPARPSERNCVRPVVIKAAT